MKILFLIDSVAFAGAELYLVQLIKHALTKQLDFKIMLNSQQDKHLFMGHVELDKSAFLSYDFNSKKNRFIKVFDLKKIIKAHKFTHIHIVLQNPNASQTALMASSLMTIKQIVSFRLVQKKELSLKQKIRNKWLFRKAKLLCVSQNNAELLISDYALNRKKISIIKNAPNIKNCPDCDKYALHKELNLDTNVKIILMLARISEQKDHKTLLEAMSIVTKTEDKLFLVCVGDIETEKEHYLKIKELTSSLNLEKFVAYLAFREDICQLLNCSYLTVLSTHHEGQPKAILEAMKLKIAVIATDVSGISEVIEHNKTGLLVEENNANDLAKAILSIIVDNEKRKELIENAYNSEILRSPEEMADETFSYYN